MTALRSITCETCSGAGHVFSQHPNSPSAVSWRNRRDCPECGGSGVFMIKIDDEDAAEPGRQQARPDPDDAWHDRGMGEVA